MIQKKVLFLFFNYYHLIFHIFTAALTDFHTLADGTPVNEETVLKSLGSAISNAKDWDGRKGRTQQK